MTQRPVERSIVLPMSDDPVVSALNAVADKLEKMAKEDMQPTGSVALPSWLVTAVVGVLVAGMLSLTSVVLDLRTDVAVMKAEQIGVVNRRFDLQRDDIKDNSDRIQLLEQRGNDGL